MKAKGITRWNHGCSGGMLVNALSYAVEYYVYDEDSYKYTGYDQQCYKPGMKYNSLSKLPSYSRLRTNDPHAIKKLLVGGPVAA